MKTLKNELDIRYIKLHFTLYLPEDCIFPVSKTSALRGGIGEMLLRANCIKDRDCEKCDFESECLVRRTLYSKFERKPKFITSGDSAGYVIECEDYQSEYTAGETVSFNLILFGKTIVYFNVFLQAIAALGQQGVGKYNAKYWIQSIRNSTGQELLQDSNIYMEYYQIKMIREYVKFRKDRVIKEGLPNTIVFHTPITIKYQGEFLKEFHMPAIIKAIQRRIYIMDYFEMIDGEELYNEDLEIPKIVDQRLKPVSVRRYSNRKEQGMWLHGIKGSIKIDKISEECLDILLAGEILHIGKNTSFGFGRYTLKKV